jgi:hypothetical protein
MCDLSPTTLYNAPLRARLPCRAGGPTLLIVALAVLCGRCSFSYQLGSLFGKDDDTPAVSTTGATAPVTDADKPMSDMPADVDLDYARAAAMEVLASGEKRGSARWENPRTGARGMVTPIAKAYIQDGLTCRDFLASFVSEGSEAWLRGEACRAKHGKWEVRSLKPRKRV